MSANSKDTLGFLLHDSARLMRRDFERRTRTLGLTRAQWQTLFHLRRNEGCNQVTLAEMLEVEPITLARVIDRLEQNGIVERRADPNDRRARLLFLGAHAHPLLDELSALGAETRAVALAGIAEEDRTKLMDLLSQVRANFASRDAAITDTTDSLTLGDIETKKKQHA